MKTLADLKRKLTIGKTLTYEHLISGWNPGPRKITHIDTVKFGFLNPVTGNTSYCDWPKAGELEFIDENTFIVHRPWYIDGKEKIVPLLRYEFLD